VRSKEPCPRDLIPIVLKEIYLMKVTPPVRLGDLLGSFHGVEIVASRSVDK
jgi:CxxC motif-containing protein